MARFYKYRGKTYRSKLEVSIVKQLYKEKRSFGYETEKLKYTVPSRNATYTPDIIIKTKTGNKIYVEIKGRLTTANRRTALLAREQNPGIDLRFVFALDNKIRKNSKTRYSDWCTKNNFVYAFKQIPQDWWDE
jgi:hypothetical protein